MHYHLRRGGVTRIIGAVDGWLRKAGVGHMVLSGEAPEASGGGGPAVRVLGDLGYGDGRGTVAPDSLAARMQALAREAAAGRRVLWHFHNHALGKNPALTAAVARLAHAGERLLLQTHDFAEDGRPQQYRAMAEPERIYPVAPQIHHAFLNSRDRELMVAAGLPAESAHLLPNPVTAPAAAAAPQAGGGSAPLVVAPVRGIRRKNLGEFCLWAAMAPRGARFAVTLGAANPAWQAIHDGWARCARDLQLPLELAVVDRLAPAPGAGRSFADWLGHASHMATTSVAEGFGLAFLEPLALGKPLVGRDIPEITRDFRRHGVDPGRLYSHLLVPQAWVDTRNLHPQLAAQLRATRTAYGRDTCTADVAAAWAALDCGGSFDFGNLPESVQAAVVRRTAGRGPDGLEVESAGTRTPAADWLAAALDRQSSIAGSSGRHDDPCEQGRMESGQGRSSPAPAAASHQARQECGGSLLSADALRQGPDCRASIMSPYAPDRCAERLLHVYRLMANAAVEEPEFLDAGAVLEFFLEPRRFHFLRT